MIPKIIHYCWLSDDAMPDLVLRCINSWKEKLPDYELILWDKKRFDLESLTWTKQAYDAKNMLLRQIIFVCIQCTRMVEYTWIRM